MKTIAAGLAAVAGGAALWLAWTAWGPAPADAQGRRIYAEYCASCHGADLEGQPNWKLPLPSGRLPAPPHDASGHTWHHPDALLFRIVKEGTAAVVGGGYETDMPGFAEVLSDDQIDAVLGFIKSQWPRRERDYQRAVTSAAAGS